MNQTARTSPGPATANRMSRNGLPASRFLRLTSRVPRPTQKRQTNPTSSCTSCSPPVARHRQASPSTSGRSKLPDDTRRECHRPAAWQGGCSFAEQGSHEVESARLA